MSIPYVPQGTSKRFFVPRTLAADFTAFLNQDIPNTNMDFVILKDWYEQFRKGYEKKTIRGEIYPDSTKSRYENTDNNMNIRCDVNSGIRKGDMVIEPDGTVYILDWEVHLQSNNAPSRALRCNMTLTVTRPAGTFVDDEGYLINNEGFVIHPQECPYAPGTHIDGEGCLVDDEGCVLVENCPAEDPATCPFARKKDLVIVHELPANAYRYDGRPEYSAISGTPGVVPNALTLLTVQYNRHTAKIHVSDKFKWGNDTFEIIDISHVGTNLQDEYGTLKLQAKKAAGGTHYDV